VVAFISVEVGNGGFSIGTNSTQTTATTLVTRPSLPGDDSTGSTLGGSTARCVDGTYSFRGGGAQVSDADLCKDHGGVDQRVP
jgi:hypothetical protein